MMPALALEKMQPGVILLNHAGKVVYLNFTAKAFLEILQKENGASLGRNTLPSSYSDVLPRILNGEKGDTPLPRLITELHRDFQKKRNGRGGGPAYDGFPAERPVFLKNNLICFARAFLLQNALSAQKAHLLILIEALPSTHNRPAVLFPRLTEREEAVVRLLFEGQANKEIAASLEISEHTVKEHLKRIRKKLNVANRAGIVAHFARPLLRNPEKKLRRAYR
ncbi:MAG: helix-turn-helix transcriptional regulator [Candidatus Manganitrophus sp.]|nr:helix-turn-helix transcriptional regulator [Candidatus Manganitrophus sp.]WDT73136.1 MAG: helix-turn-helix transcriptional regulator [Candidatus Manganitrophus sp.]